MSADLPSDPEVNADALVRMFPDWNRVPMRDLDHNYEPLCGRVNTRWMPRHAWMLTNATDGVISNDYELQDAGAGS